MRGASSKINFKICKLRRTEGRPRIAAVLMGSRVGDIYARVEFSTSARVTGLEWTELREPPTHGIEVIHEELADALKVKMSFEPAEWVAFGVTGLRADHFVRSGDIYFRPGAPVVASFSGRLGTWSLTAAD